MSKIRVNMGREYQSLSADVCRTAHAATCSWQDERRSEETITRAGFVDPLPVGRGYSRVVSGELHP